MVNCEGLKALWEFQIKVIKWDFIITNVITAFFLNKLRRKSISLFATFRCLLICSLTTESKSSKTVFIILAYVLGKQNCIVSAKSWPSQKKKNEFDRLKPQLKLQLPVINLWGLTFQRHSTKSSNHPCGVVTPWWLWLCLLPNFRK